MPRHYKTRLSQKVVLEYLKNVYPEWKKFENIYDEIPVINMDGINLTIILQKLVDKNQIEKTESEFNYCSVWRYKNEETNRH